MKPSLFEEWRCRLILEKTYYCKWWIFSVFITNLNTANARSCGCTSEWYFGMIFCWTRFYENGIVTEKESSVVDDKVSKLFQLIIWKLLIAYSNLWTTSFCNISDVKILEYGITFLFKRRRLYFLKSDNFMWNWTSIFVHNTRSIRSYHFFYRFCFCQYTLVFQRQGSAWHSEWIDYGALFA